MNKLSLYQRFFFCMALCFCLTVGYQFYLAVDMERNINDTLQETNSISSEYTKMYMDVSRENRNLKLVIQQFKTENERLYKQVNLLNEHWKGELNKVNDELFDLKNKDSGVNNNVSGKE
jgi:Tfp pilus assembly protein PilO